MTEEQFNQMRYDALPLINFVGGLMDGRHRVPPEANSVLRDPNDNSGEYRFFAGEYIWVGPPLGGPQLHIDAQEGLP